MSFKFTLCPDCLPKYRTLQYDPKAQFGPCLIPFDSIVWADEQIPATERPLFGHDTCLHSLMRLMLARKQLWRTGQIEASLQQIWREAHEILPNWPGFRRLTLTTEELRALDLCEEETAASLDRICGDASVFAVTDKGGGVVSFVAHPRLSRPSGPA
jgi:hypothetical protein